VDCGCFADTSDRTGRKGRTPDIPTVRVSLFRSCSVTKFSLTSVLRCLLAERRSSHCLPKTNTSVPDDRSQCLYCVLHIIRCALSFT